MPNKHRWPATSFRVDPELRERAKIAAAEVDSSLKAHIEAWLRWLVHDTDDLPTRPPRRH
ncbi:hypothetical protein [Mycobacteroides abscessus]|uniref:hypothetical protein n=1 Tax=Mycobacteroides abscessus TaxID=36809 RepID=UPI0010424D08|nr:hypothetical protein [Mycobacteroides abscessus]